MNKSFEEQYCEGHMPWDHGMVDKNLPRMVAQLNVAPCRALDIGCGTGDNVIWLAEQGFAVTGCDFSETAIEMAVAKNGAEDCRFLVADFLEEPLPGAPFGFVFDRGCFHSVSGEADRRNFVEGVAAVLGESGLWLSLTGNADEVRQAGGPPQMTAAELTALVEPDFEIISIESGFFGSDQENPPRAWICAMRRRD